MNPYDPPTLTATLPTPRQLSLYGYIAFAARGAPSNAADSYPGFGATPTEAIRDACYWANQMPWVRVVPANRAPRWAQEIVNATLARFAGAEER
jgi:hypothetical protein